MITTQLTIGGVVLPITSHDKYSCYPEPLRVEKTMASGRIVRETRGNVWIVKYSYDYLGDSLMRAALAVLRGDTPFAVSCIPDNGDAMITGEFIATALENPTCAFVKGGVPYWHNLSFTLREVKPHD